MSTTTVLPEGTTIIEHPRSGRKIVKDSKGNIITESRQRRAEMAH
jgi:hypothetical protein